MRRKLPYLIPLVLLVLNFLPFSLYKQTVNTGTSLDTLSPSHWKVIEINFSISGSFMEVGSSQPIPEPEPVSKDAKFKGFPIGAYFSRDLASGENGSLGSFSAKAWSWVWLLVDLALVIMAFVAAKIIIKRRKPTDTPPPPAYRPPGQFTPHGQGPPVSQPPAAPPAELPRPASPPADPRPRIEPRSQRPLQSSQDHPDRRA